MFAFFAALTLTVASADDSMGFPAGSPPAGGFNFPAGNQQGGDNSQGGGFGGSFDFGKGASAAKGGDSFGSFGGGFGHKDTSAGSFSEQSTGSGDSSSEGAKDKKTAMSEGYKQLMQKLEQLQQQESKTKNDLYAKQTARLNAAKTELSAEEEEEKAQESVMKLQSQEREIGRAHV